MIIWEMHQKLISLFVRMNAMVDPLISNHLSCLKYSQIILLNWYVRSGTKGGSYFKEGNCVLKVQDFMDIVKG